MFDTTSKKAFGRWVAVAVTVVVIVFGELSLLTVHLARNADLWVSHTQSVVAEAKALLASMVDAETSERGFILTGNYIYLQPYREALTNVPIHLERLKELTADNPAQQARLVQIESLIKAKLEIIAKILSTYSHGSMPPIDKAVMDSFRLDETAFEQEEERLYVERSKTLEDRYALIQGLCLTFTLMTAIAALIGFRKYRQVAARAQATLAEEQMRHSIESAPAAIAMFDKNMRYIAASRRFAEDYRVRWDGLIGRSHYEVFPDVPEKWREIHRRCLDGRVERCTEDPYPRLDGSTDWLSWEIRPWYDPSGAVNGIVLWSENITTRKQAEKALQESEERLQQSLEAAGIATWEWNSTTNVSVWNKQHYTLLGYEPNSVTPSHAAWSKRVLPEDLPRAEQSLRDMVDGGPDYNAEFRVLGHGGEVRWLEGRGRRRPLAEREVRYYGVMIDITKRKMAEEAVVAAKVEAEHSNLAKSKFLAAASHDLRQPVQSLTLLLYLLERQVSDKPKAAEILQTAKTSMASLNVMLASILDISRLDAGVITPTFAIVLIST